MHEKSAAGGVVGVRVRVQPGGPAAAGVGDFRRDEEALIKEEVFEAAACNRQPGSMWGHRGWERRGGGCAPVTALGLKLVRRRADANIVVDTAAGADARVEGEAGLRGEVGPAIGVARGDVVDDKNHGHGAVDVVKVVVDTGGGVAGAVRRHHEGCSHDERRHRRCGRHRAGHHGGLG